MVEGNTEYDGGLKWEPRL